MTLKRPIQQGDRLIEELLLTEPTVGQVMAATEAGDDGTDSEANEGLLTLVASIGGLPKNVLRSMLWSDLCRADQFLDRFDLGAPSRTVLLTGSRFAAALAARA